MSDNTTTTTTASTTPAPAAPAPEQRAIAVRPPAPPIRFAAGVGADLQTWEDAQRVATAFASSRYFKDVNETAQALVKITMGSELGFSPMASMLGIYIIEGRPAMSSAMINAVIKRSGRYRFEVVRWDEEACSLMWREKVEGEWLALGPSSFTMADAQRANLAGKGVWKSYPKAMLWARALTQGARAYTPDLFFGSPVYTPDELGSDVVDLPDGTQVIEPPKQAPAAQRGVAGVTAALAVNVVAEGAADERAARKSRSKAKADVIVPLEDAVRGTDGMQAEAPKVTTDSPDHPTPAAPPPAPSSSSETPPPGASSPPLSPDAEPSDTDDVDPLDAIDAASAPPSPAEIAFREAVLELSKPGLDGKAMTAIVVGASTKVDPEHKTALRIFTRALFNRTKGVDALTGIETITDRADLRRALAVEGNALGSPSILG